jgi:type II secretion system protein C
MLQPQNLQRALMQAAALPAIENGKVVGFRFSHIDEDSIYAKAGVQNGDVFTHLNGTPLNNAASAVRLLNSLRDEPNVEIELIRNGAPKKMQLRVQ